MDIVAALCGMSVDELKRWGWIVIGSALLLTFVLGIITEKLLLYLNGWRKRDDD